MPKFKENPNPIKKKSTFKMKYQGKHSAFPFKSPISLLGGLGMGAIGMANKLGKQKGWW